MKSHFAFCLGKTSLVHMVQYCSQLHSALTCSFALCKIMPDSMRRASVGGWRLDRSVHPGMAGPSELGMPIGLTQFLALIEAKPFSLNDFLLLLASPNLLTFRRACPAYCCRLPRRSDAFTPFVCILCVQLAVAVVNINGCIIGIFRELDD